MIEEAALEDYAQDAGDVFVDCGLGDGSCFHFGEDFVCRKPACSVARGDGLAGCEPCLHGRTAGHFEIHSGVDRRSSGVGTAPVGNDEPFESKLLLQNAGEKIGILGAVDAVQLVVGGHYGPDAGFLHAGFECGEIDFVEGALVDVGVDAMALKLLVIGREMLERRDDSFALHTLDIGNTHARGQVRIFAVAFKVATPERDTIDVDGGAENHVAAQGLYFLGDGLTFSLDQVAIPGGGHGYTGGEAGGDDLYRIAGGIGDGGTAGPGADAEGAVGHFYGWNSEARN